MNSEELINKEAEDFIKEYANDHYKHFGFYPYDVAVNGKIYTFEEYRRILDV